MTTLRMEHDLERLNQLAKHFSDRGDAMGYGIAGILLILGAVLLTDDLGSLSALNATAIEVAKYKSAIIAEALRQPIKSSQL